MQPESVYAVHLTRNKRPIKSLRRRWTDDFCAFIGHGLLAMGSVCRIPVGSLRIASFAWISDGLQFVWCCLSNAGELPDHFAAGMP